MRTTRLMATSPPTSQQSTPNPASIRTGLVGWNAFAQQVEHVPELRAPTMAAVYDRMLTDAQVKGVLQAILGPQLRRQAVLDPNGADDAIVRKLSEDLLVPILGEDGTVTRGRMRGHLTERRHRKDALRMLRYGAQWCELVGRIDEQGAFRLRKLAPIPCSTVRKVNTADDGGPVSIEQPKRAHDKIAGSANVISIDRLVGYVFDQDPGEWYGRSLLRAMYRHWLRKDVLLRIDALKHQRNGMGVPMAYAPPGGAPGDIERLMELARQLRAGDEAGGAAPHGSKVELMGVSGTLPDTIASIRYDDEQIARAGLADVLMLGQTPNGSRALGEVLVEGLSSFGDLIAEDYADTFNEHVIERVVTWNAGETANCPRLVVQQVEDPEASIEDLALAVERGLVTVDAEMEDWVRNRLKAPRKVRIEDDEPGVPILVSDVDRGIVTIDERRAALKMEPRADGLGSLTFPEFMAQFGGTPQDALDGDTPVEARRGPVRRLIARLRAATKDPRDVGRRRLLTANELAAATDFDALDAQWESATGDLVTAWHAERDRHIDQLVAAIEAAGGDLDELAKLAVEPSGADVIRDRMLSMADDSVTIMQAELTRQGATVPAVAREVYEAAIDARANAMAELLARAISEKAAREAVRFGQLPAKDAAAKVREKLEALTDDWLNQTLGDAMNAAQNTARFAVADTAEDEGQQLRRYASELLDTNTCSPCASVDGTEFASREEAIAAYPTGGYIDCAGGPRCRGTIVIVMGDETTASVEGEDG